MLLVLHQEMCLFRGIVSIVHLLAIGLPTSQHFELSRCKAIQMENIYF